MKKQKSDFGRGFVYNMILFAKHFERAKHHADVWREMRKENPDLFEEESALSLWFNGAGDHMFELSIPDELRNTKIGDLARDLQEYILERRMAHKVTKQEFETAFEKLEELSIEIDKHLGVKVVKAQWS